MAFKEEEDLIPIEDIPYEPPMPIELPSLEPAQVAPSSTYNTVNMLKEIRLMRRQRGKIETLDKSRQMLASQVAKLVQINEMLIKKVDEL
ncbi:hypothetical protein R1flu_028054 [Riccia fluitans]|uniref:Uncharacterized protein n=1 Tax=Riccia fluitans TaxID=41844 RepID=A0ABD1XNE4_9MARC